MSLSILTNPVTPFVPPWLDDRTVTWMACTGRHGLMTFAHREQSDKVQQLDHDRRGIGADVNPSSSTFTLGDFVSAKAITTSQSLAMVTDKEQQSSSNNNNDNDIVLENASNPNSSNNNSNNNKSVCDQMHTVVDREQQTVPLIISASNKQGLSSTATVSSGGT